MNPAGCTDLITPHTLSLLQLSLHAYSSETGQVIQGLALALAQLFLAPPVPSSANSPSPVASSSSSSSSTGIPIFEPTLDELCSMLENKSQSLRKVREVLTAEVCLLLLLLLLRTLLISSILSTSLSLSPILEAASLKVN